MKPSLSERIGRFAPGVPELLRYKREDLSHDIAAGLAVAAVALPVGVAYAQLAGFSAEIGLYSSIFPLLVYFFFGTSRQLILGPDAATCALVAATIGPLALGNPQAYMTLTAVLTLFAGLFCIAASFLKLGALANFLSRPILVGFLNGVAISIALGQSGKLFGFAIEHKGIPKVALEIYRKIGLIHWPTLAVGIFAFAVLLLAPRMTKRLPAGLIAMIVTATAVALFGLESAGVATLGRVPSGLPMLGMPADSLQLLDDHLGEILGGAAGIALISFSSAMLTARSFAAKNHYDIDVDREFAALGIANIASALFSGFAISGADSRTAMNDSAGGRTRVAGLIAAAAVALALLFLTAPLQFVPVAALGAVLIMAALSLLDLRSLQHFWRVNRIEFGISLIATIGVIRFGALQAIVFVVVLSLLRFVQLVARPRVEILGTIPGAQGFHALSRHPDAVVTPGLVMFRFNGPVVFFNADYFKREAIKAADREGAQLRWFVIDMLPITQSDVTGIDAVLEFDAELTRRGVELAIAGRRAETKARLEERGLPQLVPDDRHFTTLLNAQRAYCARTGFADPDPTAAERRDIDDVGVTGEASDSPGSPA
ncbi:MAG TPA: SulP family inorganic anion transporter [Spongiibacteraceae bacterium]|nr:SulP family inorganic anion transporter [Spongiibacteraceae bacterium]